MEAAEGRRRGGEKPPKKGRTRDAALTAEEEARRREAVRETLRERVEPERRALKVVERLLEDSVGEDFLIDCARFITPANYRDAVDERSIAKLCGYPTCPNTLSQITAQKYKISTKTNKVFDITERKCFCSNFCYKASKQFELQISRTPLWLRQSETPPAVTLMKTGHGGSSGEEMMLSERRLEEKDVEETLAAPPEGPPSSQQDHQEQDFISSLVSQQGGPRVHWGDPPKRTDEDEDERREVERRKTRMREGEEDETDEEKKLGEDVKHKTGSEEERLSSNADQTEEEGSPAGAPSGPSLLSVPETVAAPHAAPPHAAPPHTAPPHAAPPHTAPHAAPHAAPPHTAPYAAPHAAPPHTAPYAAPDAAPPHAPPYAAPYAAPHTAPPCAAPPHAPPHASPHAPPHAPPHASPQAAPSHAALHAAPHDPPHATQATPPHAALHAAPPHAPPHAAPLAPPPLASSFQRRDGTDLSGLAVTQVGVSRRGAAGLRVLLQNCPTGGEPDSFRLTLLEGLQRTLKDWRTDTTMMFLYGSGPPPGPPLSGACGEEELDEDDLHEEVKGASAASDFEALRKEVQQLQLRVQDFYKGTWTLPEDVQEQPEEEVKVQDQNPKDPLLPLLDSQAQHLIQKRIAVERLMSCLRNVVAPLRLTMSDIITDLNNLVRTFSFTSKNIIHRTPEWILIGVVLLHLLSQVSPVVRDALQTPASVEYLNTLMKGVGLQEEDLLTLIRVFKPPTHTHTTRYGLVTDTHSGPQTE